MKIFLIFISGLVATLLVLAGVFYFLFVPHVAENTFTDTAIDPSDRFTISGTIVVPEPLRPTVKNGAGALIIHLFSGPLYAPIELVVPKVEKPTFPFKFSKTFSRTALKGNKVVDGNFTIFADYRFDKDIPQEKMVAYYSTPRVTGRKRVALSKEQVESMSVPEAVDIGNLYLTRHYKRAAADKCLSASTLLSGKIIPSTDFAKVNSGAKFALVVSPDEPIFSRLAQSSLSAETLDSFVIHYQFLNFSEGPVAFSVPFKKINSLYMILTAVKCTDGESLKNCAARSFPLSPDFSNTSRFRITGKAFEAPFCGTTAFEAYIHQPEITEVASGVPEPHPPGAAAPQEFISGENISK